MLLVASLRSRRGDEGAGPAAVLLNHIVDLSHQPDGLGQGDDYLLVVSDVLVAEGAALAVLEPLVADLVAADVKVPDGFRNTDETGRLVLVNPNGVLRPRKVVKPLISSLDIEGREMVGVNLSPFAISSSLPVHRAVSRP